MKCASSRCPGLSSTPCLYCASVCGVKVSGRGISAARFLVQGVHVLQPARLNPLDAGLLRVLYLGVGGPLRHCEYGTLGAVAPPPLRLAQGLGGVSRTAPACSPNPTRRPAPCLRADCGGLFEPCGWSA